MFTDRIDAAHRLAQALSGYQGEHPLVLAIPRGAVPMAKLIAAELGGEVDVVLVRKLPAPGNPEFAIGAVDESGWTYLADHARRMGIDDAYIEEERAAQVALMARRRAQYTPVRPPIEAAGRVVIVVDDGLATGSTMIAALHAIRAKGPRKLICAVPVAPPETADRVREDCDDLVCLETPQAFHAVGQFYRSFPQVEDDEVIALLAADNQS
jgi:predicted phosphoribosyltransferase